MPTLTAIVGTNADLMPPIFGLYAPEGSVVADVTFGRGVFWKRVDLSKYRLLPTDLLSGVDFRSLPYEDASVDVILFDPPYMHGSNGPSTIKDSINKCYRNENGSHEAVIRLYAAGLLEAARVLRKNGVAIVKCQDEIESGRQRLSHVEVIDLLTLFGFDVVDLFVLMQGTVPAMREPRQQHARKNHSYAVVARLRR